MKKIVMAVVALAVVAARPLCADGMFAVGDKVSGFAVKSVTDLPEIKGRMVRM